VYYNVDDSDDDDKSSDISSSSSSSVGDFDDENISNVEENRTDSEKLSEESNSCIAADSSIEDCVSAPSIQNTKLLKECKEKMSSDSIDSTVIEQESCICQPGLNAVEKN